MLGGYVTMGQGRTLRTYVQEEMLASATRGPGKV